MPSPARFVGIMLVLYAMVGLGLAFASLLYGAIVQPTPTMTNPFPVIVSLFLVLDMTVFPLTFGTVLAAWAGWNAGMVVQRRDQAAATGALSSMVGYAAMMGVMSLVLLASVGLQTITPTTAGAGGSDLSSPTLVAKSLVVSVPASLVAGILSSALVAGVAALLPSLVIAKP